MKKVFPELRRRCRQRFVEIVEVDLRWGITVEQAESGQVLPICLSEIEKCRPFFVGLLGERYGWVPAKNVYAADLMERLPWLSEHAGGKSVTELEMLHGVLNNPEMAGRALFYFRDRAWSETLGADGLSESPADQRRLEGLKDRIRQSGFPGSKAYENRAKLRACRGKPLGAGSDKLILWMRPVGGRTEDGRTPILRIAALPPAMTTAAAIEISFSGSRVEVARSPVVAGSPAWIV